MKPDIKLFPTLRTEEKFPLCYQTFRAVMMGTGMGLLLDKNSVPSTDEERLNHRNRNWWLYTVLDKTLLTVEGRNILDKYRSSCDGQRVIFELFTHHSVSTGAQLHAHELHNKIVNTKFDWSWSGTAIEYISELLRDVQRYNSLVPRENKLTDEMIRSTLERNVEAARPLNAVKERDLFDVAKGAPKLAFNQCVNLAT